MTLLPQKLNDDFNERRRLLVRRVREQGVTHPDVLAALQNVPRHLLVPQHLVDLAYEDRPLPIGDEQTISQPTIVGLMSQWAIEHASRDQRRRVLEVGTGSGYQTAILAELFDEVFTVEIRPTLFHRGQELMGHLDLRPGSIHSVMGNGAIGLPEFAPFDAIVVAAVADEVPPALMKQLKQGGRLVIPVEENAGQLLNVFRRAHDDLERLHSLPVQFVPLIDEADLS